MQGYCAICGQPLNTGDFGRICQKCKDSGYQVLKNGISMPTSTAYNKPIKKVRLDDSTYACYDNVSGWHIVKE